MTSNIHSHEASCFVDLVLFDKVRAVLNPISKRDSMSRFVHLEFRAIDINSDIDVIDASVIVTNRSDDFNGIHTINLVAVTAGDISGKQNVDRFGKAI